MTCVEKDIPYELVPVDRGSDTHGALHPFRRMPILEIDGAIIFESAQSAASSARHSQAQPCSPRATLRAHACECG
jgi:hypothetical protein